MQLEKLDAKCSGVIFKVKNGTIVTDDQYMVFLAKDNAFAAILPMYRAKCVELGADQEHIAVVDRTILRLGLWRAANASACKVPDAKGELLIG